MMQKLTQVHYTKPIIRKQHRVDANGKILGRVAQEVAQLLRGKQKPFFSYHQDSGDPVVVVNAGGIRVTGNKLKEKIYTRYSGYPGGLKKIPLEKMLQESPEKVIQHAVRGMLPRSPLGERIFQKLKVYRGEEPHVKVKEKEVQKEKTS